MVSKSALRKKYKTLRKELTAAQLDDFSIDIANQLLKLPVWNKRYYQLFLTIYEHKEVETEFILNILSGKDKDIILSKSNSSLDLILLSSSDNKYKRESLSAFFISFKYIFVSLSNFLIRYKE